LHHGHNQVARFPMLLQKMKPYLMALNLNGMFKDGPRLNLQIAPIGQGPLDLDLLRTIGASGWNGPIGILNHTDEDAEARLKDNLDGLDWVVNQICGNASVPRPTPRSWQK
jgi:hypothetical protein